MAERQSSLDGLAESYLVAEKEAAREAVNDGVDHSILVGPRCDGTRLHTEPRRRREERGLTKESECCPCVSPLLPLQRVHGRRLIGSKFEQALLYGIR